MLGDDGCGGPVYNRPISNTDFTQLSSADFLNVSYAAAHVSFGTENVPSVHGVAHMIADEASCDVNVFPAELIILKVLEVRQRPRLLASRTKGRLV
jgi:hypothetical protein